MAKLILMPKLGFNMNDGKIVAWYKKENEIINKGEPFFSIQTDKTVIDIDATESGMVLKILATEGDIVDVTLPIAIVGEESEDISKILKEASVLTGKQEVVQTEQIAKPEEPNKNKSTSSFDVAVIGGGIGGYVSAIKAAQYGKSVCLIEKKERLGGVCLNVGCIPTKALLKSVEVFNVVKNAEIFGVKGIQQEAVIPDMSLFQKRKQQIVERLTNGVKYLLDSNGVVVIRGDARAIDSHRIKVGEDVVEAENIIVATGSSPATFSFISENNPYVKNSKDILSINFIPDRMVIIGGGIIGFEFAYLFANLGTQVTIVEYMDRILPMVDKDISNMARENLADLGVKFFTSSKVIAIEKNEVTFEENGGTQKLQSELILVSVGRKPNISDFTLEGLEIEKGGIKVDSYLRTSIPNIFAVGDVNGKSMLAHTALMEGLVAVENICGNKIEMEYHAVPGCIYGYPELAWVGLSEEEARKLNKNIEVGVFPLSGNGKAQIEGVKGGVIKVVIDSRLKEILGVHIYAPHATDMINEISLAINMEASVEEVIRTVHPHPTISEIIPEAFHASLGRAIHY